MDIVISDASRASNPYINKIKPVLGDITAQDADAIVSMLPQSLEVAGSINQSILKQAGGDLDDFILENIYQPKAGDVYAVPGFALPCKNIIYAVRPNWKSDFEREDKHLVMCVRKSLVLAKCMLLNTVAFPPLGAGRKAFGKGRAARIMIHSILDRLDEHPREVRIVCADKETLGIYIERLRAYGWRG